MPQKSTGEYPPDWKEISKHVKDLADWKCVRCEHGHNPKEGYCLTVHHLDMDKSNCAWWNIPALCQRCHLRIQGKVVMSRFYMLEHSQWFRSYLAGYYAKQIGWIGSINYYESAKEFTRDEAAKEFNMLIIAVKEGSHPIRGTGHFEEVW